MNAALADSDKKEGTAAALRPEIRMDVVLLGGKAKRLITSLGIFAWGSFGCTVCGRAWGVACCPSV